MTDGCEKKELAGKAIRKIVKTKGDKIEPHLIAVARAMTEVRTPRGVLRNEFGFA